MSFKLKKITPRALKTYKKHGLLNMKSDNSESAEKIFEVYCDDKALAEILDVSFVEQMKDIENVDLAKVSEGISDFLAQLAGSLTKSGA